MKTCPALILFFLLSISPVRADDLLLGAMEDARNVFTEEVLSANELEVPGDDVAEMKRAVNPTLKRKTIPNPLSGIHQLVRPLFRFDRGSKTWKKITLPLADRKWTVHFDGKTLGPVNARSFPVTVATIGTEVLVALPSEETRSALAKFFAESRPEFRTNVPAGETVRPFVVTTGDRSVDSDGWAPAVPDAAILTPARAAFIEQFKNEPECSGPKIGKSGKIRLKPDDVKILNKTYRSKAGTWIVTLYFKNHSCDWGEGPEGAHAGMTYVVEKGGKPRPLGSGLVLVDAGDYAGRGASDLLFFESRANFDGYVLYSDRFRKKAENGWTYL